MGGAADYPDQQYCKPDDQIAQKNNASRRINLQTLQISVLPFWPAF